MPIKIMKKQKNVTVHNYSNSANACLRKQLSISIVCLFVSSLSPTITNEEKRKNQF